MDIKYLTDKCHNPSTSSSSLVCWLICGPSREAQSSSQARIFQTSQARSRLSQAGGKPCNSQVLNISLHSACFCSRGLGLAIVRHLARRGAKVYMAARDEQRAKAAIERLRSEGLGKGEVEWWELDLSKPREVKESGERFVQRVSRLDILGEHLQVPTRWCWVDVCERRLQ